MVKNLRKMFIFVALIALTLTIAACGKSSSSKTDQKKVNAAVEKLVITQDKQKVTTDFTLPIVTGENQEITITWTSSNETYVKIGDIDEENKVVNVEVELLPVGSQNLEITLTATLTYKKASATKEFKVRAVALEPDLTTDKIATVLTANKNDLVLLNNVRVVGEKTTEGIYVTDGKDVIYVFTKADTNFANVTYTDGELVSVMGKFTLYYNMPEIGLTSEAPIINKLEGASVPTDYTSLDVVEATPAKICDLKSLKVADFTKIYKVTGNIIEITSGSKNKYAISDGVNDVEIYYKSPEAVINAVAAKKGTSVSLYVAYNGYNSSYGTSSAYVLTTSAIGNASEQDLLNSYVDIIEINKDKTTTNFTVPKTVRNMNITWTSNNAAISVDSATGAATITRPAAGSTGELKGIVVTLTATITDGTLTASKTFEVLVLEIGQVLEYTKINTITKNSGQVEIEGIITYVAKNGSYINDGTGTIFLSGYKTSPKGTEVAVLGTAGENYGAIQLTGCEVTAATSAAGTYTLPEYTAVTPATFQDKTLSANKELLYSHIVLTGTLLSEVSGSYTNYYITDGTTKVLVYFSSSVISPDTLAVYVGKEVSLKTVVVGYHSSNKYWQVSYSYEEDFQANLTDAEVVAADKANAESYVSTKTVEDELVLTLVGTYGSTITWASDNEAIAIATDGKVTITRPTGSDVTVTLTYIMTKNGATETGTIEVTVKAEGVVLTSIQQALANISTTESTVKYTVTGKIIFIDGKNVYINDGAAGIVVYLTATSSDISVGDVITATGTIVTYKGLNEVKLAANTDFSVVTDTDFVVNTTTTTLDQITLASQANLFKTTKVYVKSYKASGNSYLADFAGNELLFYKMTLPTGIELYDVVDVTYVVGAYNNAQGRVIEIVANTEALSATEEAIIGALVVADAKSSLTVESSLTENVTLPLTSGEATITWGSNNEAIAINSETGVATVTRHATDDITVTLTATITCKGATDTKTFEVTVPSQSTTVVETSTATLKYAGGSTTNMVEGNNAAKIGLDETIFTVTATKNDGSNLPGLNTAGNIRLYGNASGNGNTITVSSTKKILSITISFVTGKETGAAVLVDGAQVTGVDNTFEINGNSFTLKNVNTSTTQVHINSVTIIYEK